jgi:hypothetical protein
MAKIRHREGLPTIQTELRIPAQVSPAKMGMSNRTATTSKSRTDAPMPACNVCKASMTLRARIRGSRFQCSRILAIKEILFR